MEVERREETATVIAWGQVLFRASLGCLATLLAIRMTFKNSVQFVMSKKTARRAFPRAMI